MVSNGPTFHQNLAVEYHTQYSLLVIDASCYRQSLGLVIILLSCSVLDSKGHGGVSSAGSPWTSLVLRLPQHPGQTCLTHLPCYQIIISGTVLCPALEGELPMDKDPVFVHLCSLSAQHSAQQTLNTQKYLAQRRNQLIPPQVKGEFYPKCDSSLSHIYIYI